MNKNNDLGSDLSIAQPADEDNFYDFSGQTPNSVDQICRLKYKLFQSKLYIVEQSNLLDSQNAKINGDQSTNHALKALRFFRHPRWIRRH